MINNIYVFYGSKQDFNEYVIQKIERIDNAIPFMEMIQHYNARLRPNESGVGEDALYEKIEVESCIVRADDYASVLPHVLSNFSTIVGLNYDLENLFIHNPPKRVVASLEGIYSENITYENSKYKSLSREILKDVYIELKGKILGQETCKKEIISSLYNLTKQLDHKPAVLMLYGPSGVGKTETAKCISNILGGELLRIQFSMMQTVEAYDYVFGAEHSKDSFARDLIGRETNVILIDEFDKVSPNFYNAFYQLFDEGKYVDTNYEVELQDAIFLCTSNFMSEDEIKKILGPAMYSRIGACIKYEELERDDKCLIIENWYHKVLEKLDDEEREVIGHSDILQWFKDNVERYNNIRTLKIRLENAIFEMLTEELLKDI